MMKAISLEILDERKSASLEWQGLFKGNHDLIQAIGCGGKNVAPSNEEHL